MRQDIAAAYRAAFPVTSPVMGGFLVLGISCGLFTVVNGLPGWFAPLMSVVIFGGSLEFVAAVMLTGSFAPFETAVVAFVVQARHILYGIAMLTRYRADGWKKAYLVYSLTDESFAINRTTDPPEGVNRTWFFIAVSSLNQASWILGTAIGAVAGPLIPFDTSGLAFVMTALFVVILVEQVLKDGGMHFALIGFVSSVACLAVFGSGSFLVPALVVMVVLLLLYGKIKGKGVWKWN